MKPYLRSSWRPSFQDIWLAGSESDSAGPLGTTENRLFNSDATARHEKKRKREKQKLWTALNRNLNVTEADNIMGPNYRAHKDLVKHTLICLCLWFLVPRTLVISCLQLLVLSPVTQQRNTWGQRFELPQIHLSLEESLCLEHANSQDRLKE